MNDFHGVFVTPRRSLSSRGILVLIAALALVGAATAVGLRTIGRASGIVPASGEVRSPKSKVSTKARQPDPNSPTEQLLQLDPRTITSQWILEHFRMPEPFQSQAAAAVNNDQAFDSALGNYFHQLRDVRELPEFIRNAGTVENYKNGILRTGQNEQLPFKLPFDWGQTELGMNHLAELHSLRLLTNFMEEYRKTSNYEYRDLVEQILLDWIEKNPYANPVHPRAWHEGAVAKRLVVLLNLLQHYKTIDPPHKLSWKLLIALVYQHAEYLMRPESYLPDGNHGMRQDLALLTGALVLPDLDRSKDWLRTGLHRLKTQQIATGFSTEGIWHEHSPGYHNYVMNMLDDVMNLIHANQVPEPTEFLDKLSANSQHYLAHVLSPSGFFPPVGDTNEKDLSERLVNTPAIVYSSTGGIEGKPLTDLDGFFPDAGEAVSRDSWGEGKPAGWYGKNAFYIHMHAANHHGFGHRHADELSFVMYGLGRWWIIEGGKYAYDQDAWRDFVKSTQAHNGYTFNGEGYPSARQRDRTKDVKFEPTMVSTPQLAAVRTRSTRFVPKDVEATRTFVFLRERHTLVLLDHLKSPQAGDWQGYMYLAPDLAPTVKDGAVEAIASTDPTIRLEVVTETSQLKSMDVVKGQKDPILGWISPDFRKMVPAPVLVANRAGNDVVNATVIRVGNVAMPAVGQVKSELKNGKYFVSWIEGTEELTIEIGAGQPLQVSFHANN